MLLLLPFGIFLVDRLVKILAQRFLSVQPGGVPLWPGVVRLYYAQNTGMAFGFLSGQRWLLVLLSLAAVAAVFFSLRPYQLGLWAKLSLLAILGGMLGNLADRMFLGYVVDMIDFEFMRFAVFNVADMFISLGAVFLCISLLLRPDDWRRKGEKAQAS